MFEGSKILIGVTGGISAYKTCDIIRTLKKNGADCRIIMTRSAQQFIAPLTFETLSENSVLCNLFPEQRLARTIHIENARWADVVLICPATANCIGKIANGLADDLLSTSVMATTAPVVLCPAMNKQMYLNPIVQGNIRKLSQLGYRFVVPGEGSLACGEEGIGRLAEKNRIIDSLKIALFGTDKLKGKCVLITAGRTEEALDPVRFLTNRSSGKMGFALAEIAALHGAEVKLICGPNTLEPFAGVAIHRIRSAEEMAQAVFDEFEAYDIIIMAAAVADFKPCEVSKNKIKKKDAKLSIRLEPTTDILHELGTRKGNRILVGFAVETTDEIANARRKLVEKKLDLIAINNPLTPGAAFEADTNAVTLLNSADELVQLPLDTKRNIAAQIFERIIPLANER
ncbi:bifunctional phosphopantothenoylcysteine decarboxylase/phosphopantothenate--cysteine ligase CoaBC [candidate division KSB1 bacterium]|nr:bifunctional phosphopantothenoylcysteine decarboxylase/phosphopantothenate--cysteine ligase CoaBC [candidate division KSB1 bacterium]